MIASLSGKIKLKKGSFVVLEVAGIGYKIFVLPQILDSLEEEKKADFYTFHYIREDQESLFGFLSVEEVEFFELLNSVAGVGPKSALGIMSIGSVKVLKQAISKGDGSFLTRVSGVGRKTAERVILDLKDKIGLPFKGREVPQNLEDAFDALLGLGYRRREAEAVLSKIPSDIHDTSEQVRAALKIMGQRK